MTNDNISPEVDSKPEAGYINTNYNHCNSNTRVNLAEQEKSDL
jgi:hypothetical protein